MIKETIFLVVIASVDSMPYASNAVNGGGISVTQMPSMEVCESLKSRISMNISGMNVLKKAERNELMIKCMNVKTNE